MKFKYFFILVLSIIMILSINLQCYAASKSAQVRSSTFTQTHTVNISGYGNVDVTVKWNYTDGSSASFVSYIGSSYKGNHKYVDCHNSYHDISSNGDMCKYSFGVIFDNEDSYLITVYCDIYGEVGQYYSELPSVGRTLSVE